MWAKLLLAGLSSHEDPSVSSGWHYSTPWSPGSTSNVISILTGNDSSWTGFGYGTISVDKIKKAVSNKKVVVAYSGYASGLEITGIVAKHAYAVVDYYNASFWWKYPARDKWMKCNRDYVVLLNPHGSNDFIDDRYKDKSGKYGDHAIILSADEFRNNFFSASYEL